LFTRSHTLKPNSISGYEIFFRCLKADTGYADQSHLVRDFVAFTGRSPTKWMAEEFGNVQAKDTPGGRD
jgi:hypothetical protein